LITFSALSVFAAVFSSATFATGFWAGLRSALAITFSPSLGARFKTGAAGVTLLFDAGTGFTFGAVLGTDLATGLAMDLATGLVTAFTVFLATGFAAGLTTFLTALTGAADFFTGFITDFFVGMI
jgi:hypothetical protein